MSEAGAQNGHALPALQQPYAIPEAIPRGKHGPIGPQRSRPAADSSSKSAHSTAGLANGSAGIPATPEGPHSQGAASSYQGYGGFSQDTYGVPRDYDFKSQDALSQSGDMYLTQNFPAFQTQVSCCLACLPAAWLAAHSPSLLSCYSQASQEAAAGDPRVSSSCIRVAHSPQCS